ncbi:MAG: polysaccharide biosynthesis protein, partial [Deltaproteobacteria bacterium]|nr:polysaccharide biosynthesis protein [Deltaproteobacteria bacterium]
LRPGEKLYEELITKSEGIENTNHDKIMVLYGNGITYTALNQHIQPLLESAQKHDDQEIKLALKKLIPEYTPFSPKNNQSTEY